MNFEAVIFDMDGVLVDSEPLWKQAEIACFAEHGVQLTEQLCHSTAGMRLEEVICHWAGKYPALLGKETPLLEAIVEQMVCLVEREARPMAGVLPCLQRLRALGLPLAVASSSHLRLIQAVMKGCGFGGFFDALVSAEALPYGKPHPEVFLLAAEKLGVAARKCMVVEDSVFGVIAARAAQMKVLAVPAPVDFGRPEFGVAHWKAKSLEAFPYGALGVSLP
ncbi:MAG: hexitol phosphatase HxpB [Myxococcota bacterium]|nr:hexitol phosphatase HxpB [Myxococcota bacterium]